jgi:hypothetical protein
LPAPQQQALASAFGSVEGPAPDRFLVGLAILTLLSEVASDGGLLCVTDDAQWLDRASAEVLAFVARGSHIDRIAFLFAVRDPEGGSIPLEGSTTFTLPGLDKRYTGELLSSLVTGPIDNKVATESSPSPPAIRWR